MRTKGRAHPPRAACRTELPLGCILQGLGSCSFVYFCVLSKLGSLSVIATAKASQKLCDVMFRQIKLCNIIPGRFSLLITPEHSCPYPVTLSLDSSLASRPCFPFSPSLPHVCQVCCPCPSLCPCSVPSSIAALPPGASSPSSALPLIQTHKAFLTLAVRFVLCFSHAFLPSPPS